MKKLPVIFNIFLLTLLVSITSKAQFYNGMQTEFGKNRVQHEQFLWQFYRFQNFDTYFYLGGKEVAVYTAQSASKNIKEIEGLFDYTLDDNIQFIIYNKQSDFRQSNIGLITDAQYNIGGVTRIAGSKVIIYYEGDHQKLEEQIRAGIAEVLLNQMMYGGNWKDMVKNSTLLNLPEWYVKGLFSYIANPNNPKVEERTRDGIMSGRYKKLNRLTGEDAVYAGHSIWKYIADSYGTSVIPNILYMTKVSRNIESGYLFVLGVSLKNLSKEWVAHNQKKFNEAEKVKSDPVTTDIVKKPKITRTYSQFKISPDGKYAVFTTNELGQYKLWLYNYEKKKTKRILKSGQKLDRINDYSYPLVAWHPSSELFSFITEKKGDVILSYYTLETKKIESRPPLFNFEKVLDFYYSQDGKKYVMSATQNGQTDIFVFNVATSNIEQITKDFYDDLNPRFINNSNDIVFTSNRTDDTIRFETQSAIQQLPLNKDIFQFNYVTKSPVLKRITNTPQVNEMQPVEYDKQHIAYLRSENGITNRYLAHFDSVISHIDTSAHYRYVTTTAPLTDYKRGIIEHDVNVKAGKISEVIFYKGRYRLNVAELSPSASLNLDFKSSDEAAATAGTSTDEKNKESKKVDKSQTISTVKVFGDEKKEEKKNDGSIDINNYKFENESKEETPVQQPSAATPDTAVKSNGSVVIKEKEEPAEDTFVLPKQRTYQRTYSPDQIVSQFDNSFLNTNYQKFTGGGIYFNPGFSGLIKLGASDVFEDYRIVGGFRLSGNFDSNEYFLSYEDRSKRLDKQVVFHRQSFKSPDFYATKVLSHTLRYGVKWPFSEVASLRGALSMRNDKSIFLSVDDRNLRRNNLNENWAIAKAEYIYDNTISRGLNLYTGMRFKTFAEYFNKLGEDNIRMTILGLDFRHYKKIHRELIWANRFAASTSIGNRKLVYYMGGVDNWLNFGKYPTFNNNIPTDTAQHYAYQTLATNMRGFTQNIRNGNSFAVINSELRWPIFKYLFNRPLRSDFLNNFQVIGFGDIGSAWTGKTPYSTDNSFNTEVITNGPLTIILKSHREPIVGGYGFGLRSRLWGYFVRADWAWGVDDGIVQPSIFYLSLSLDF